MKQKTINSYFEEMAASNKQKSPGGTAPTSNMDQSDYPNFVKCMTCYKDFDSKKGKKCGSDVTTRIFDNYCRLLKVQLILPMQWNFVTDILPFCNVCAATVTKLLELGDQLQLIQREMQNTLQKVKIEILKSQDAHSKRMMEPLGRRRGTRGSASYIEKIDYFRSFAVKDLDPDIKLYKNNALKTFVETTATPQANVIPPVKKFIQEVKGDINFRASGAEIIPEQMDVDMDEDNYEPLVAESDHSENNDEENAPTVKIENANKTDLASGLKFLKTSAPKMNEKEYIVKYATKSGKNEFSCNLCKHKFAANRICNFKRHVMTQHQKVARYQCKFCSKQFTFLYEGTAHIRTAHADVPLNEIPQPSQSKQSKRSRSVSSISTEEIPKELTRRNGQSPMLIPLEEISKRVIVLKPLDGIPHSEKYKKYYKKDGEMFACTICKHRLRTLKDITRHIHQSHKGEENFQCMYCPKKFFEKYVCVSHLKSHHRDTLRQEFEALNKKINSKKGVPKVTDVATSSESSLESHPYLKVGDKWKCKGCSYISKQRSNVCRHIRRKVCGLNYKIKSVSKKKMSFAKPLKEKVSATTDIQMEEQDQQTSSQNLEIVEQDGIIYRSMNHNDSAVTSCIEDRGSKIKKRYRCRKCKNYGSTGRNGVVRHLIEVHFKIIPFECSICHKRFRIRKKCRIHMAKHTSELKTPSSSTLSATPSKHQVEETATQSPISTEIESNEHNQGEDNSNNGNETLNTSRTRPSRNASRMIKSEKIEPDEFCLTLPKTMEFPLPSEILNKYLSEPNSSHCMVCDKTFAMIQPHIANVHEGVRNYRCLLCNQEFFYRGKCIYHIKDSCLSKTEAERKSSNKKQEPVSLSSPEKSNALVNLIDQNKTPDVGSSQPKISISKPAVVAKKTVKPKVIKTPVTPSGVYKDYYQRIGKMAFCKLCKKRITNARNIACHFVSKHKDLCLYSCGICDEKFQKKPLLNQHLVSIHGSVLPSASESNLAGKDNEVIEDNVQVIKTEATWVELPTPVDENPADSFLAMPEERSPPSPVDNSDSPDEGPPSPIERPSEPEPEPEPQNKISNHEAKSMTQGHGTVTEYGCISLPHSADVNCDPFIDKDSANKCKVCNMSFKMRKLTIEHVKNVHLGVRRFQCEFCNKKYYNLSQCKQHVKSSHPINNTEQRYQEDRISVSTSNEQENIDTDTAFSSSLQISNVHSQATVSEPIITPCMPPEHVEISSSMMAVEEPVSFEPWKQLPSSQEQTEPFFAVVSDESDEGNSDEDSQFVVFEQNGFGNDNSKDVAPTDNNSLYDFVGDENIIELQLDKPQLPVTSYTEIGGSFVCDICKREFVSRQAVTSHINIKHKQVEKFMCKMCDKKYYRKYSVAQHIAAVHMQKKLFKCTICQTSYSHSQTLRKHNIAVHGVTPVYNRSGNGDQWCEICSLPFQSAKDLMAHADRFHPVYKQLEF